MDREWEEAKKYMSEKQIARMELKRQKSLSSMKWAKIHGKRIPINIYDEKKKATTGREFQLLGTNVVCAVVGCDHCKEYKQLSTERYYK